MKLFMHATHHHRIFINYIGLWQNATIDTHNNE